MVWRCWPLRRAAICLSNRLRFRLIMPASEGLEGKADVAGTGTSILILCR